MAKEMFQSYLDSNQIRDIKIIVSKEQTHTAEQAAQVHNVPVCNIVKSLLLNGDGKFYLLLVPGDKRLDIDKWKVKLRVTHLRMGNADEVKEISGYSIGGVPPFGHKEKVETYIDDGFDKSTLLVAAAGSANSVFKIRYDYLVQLISS